MNSLKKTKKLIVTLFILSKPVSRKTHSANSNSHIITILSYMDFTQLFTPF